MKFVESLAIVLESRTPKKITLRLPNNDLQDYEILNIFPFTSETKRMGIVVKSVLTGEIYFFLKGAEVISPSSLDIPTDVCSVCNADPC